MFLNYLFIAFFVVGIAIGVCYALGTGNSEILSEMVQATFNSSKTAFELALALTGILCFWLGIMNIGKESGLMQRISHAIAPVLGALFPSIPKTHPVLGNIFMNVSANLLGLDNAATPLGLKAMEQLQELNLNKQQASDAQIMFIVLNAGGLTLIPTSIMAYRMMSGAANPSDIFLPILLATLLSSLTGVLAVCIKQKIKLLQPALLLLASAIFLFISLIIAGWWWLPAPLFRTTSQAVSAGVLLSIILLFMLSGWRKKINVYEAFISGAKEGFSTAISIVPYLVAMLVAIGIFRASGGMQLLIEGLRWIVLQLGLSADWVEALPTMLMKPLSGSGARALMVDAMNTYGADSLVGRIACAAQGATDTTLYIVALYFGAVRITRTRYTVSYSLLADAVGLIACIPICHLFFG